MGQGCHYAVLKCKPRVTSTDTHTTLPPRVPPGWCFCARPGRRSPGPSRAGLGPTAEGGLKAPPLQSAAQASTQSAQPPSHPRPGPSQAGEQGRGSNQAHGQTSRSQSTRSWNRGREQGPPSNHSRVERGWVVSQGPLLQGPKPQFPHLTLSTQ